MALAGWDEIQMDQELCENIEESHFLQEVKRKTFLSVTHL